MHLDFVVDGIDGAVDKARNAGARLEGPVRTNSWGKIAMLADPFGHGICLIEFLGRGYDEIAIPDDEPRRQQKRVDQPQIESRALAFLFCELTSPVSDSHSFSSFALLISHVRTRLLEMRSFARGLHAAAAAAGRMPQVRRRAACLQAVRVVQHCGREALP